MKSPLHISWMVLLLLVMIMSATAFYLKEYFYFTEIILGLSALKFLIVAFQFMEVKKAHILWKIAIIAIVLIILGSIAIIFS